MLMQFCKGAGCIELSGMKMVDKRHNYTLLRPLLELEKEELLEYLKEHNHHYFIDESNSDEKYKRNEFRHNYARPLLKKYTKGIKKSFQYIDEDVKEIYEEIEIKQCNKLSYFQRSKKNPSNLIAIDKYFKSIGKLLSANERELLKAQKSVVIARRYIVSQMQSYTFIAPYIKQKHMEKKFKEKMRLLKVDVKLRAYLASDAEAVLLVSLLLQ
jgi:tRNA(Ile)-lysidine synthase